MPKRKVDEAMLAKIVRLKRRGMKDTEIGKELGLDRRTVKANADRMNKITNYEHWQKVTDQVDAVLLTRHYEDLINLGTDIQEEIGKANDPTSDPDVRGEEYINNGFTRVFGHDSDTDEIGFGDPFSRDQVLRRAVALGNRLLAGLGEHEPALEDAIKGWTEAFDRFQEEKRALIEQQELSFQEYGFDGPNIPQAARLV